MATRIIAAALNLASILGLVFIKNISLAWRIAILVVGCACVGYLIYDVIKSSQKNEIVCRNNEDIATIIRYNKNNPQVAIANIQNSVRRNNSFRHVIYETIDSGCQQDKWINSLALDTI